ncbi:NAD(P)-dependent alcohol dehydrogenase [Streptantibioticus cattleyicolor]|uniref:Alcohol dehydrogenase zinc-binding domain protein n=1 Tax=Streptantibioticus cattleyicolor (strain ATCC 35852 / DSM 46488 / JCM 4925 / NBRC 14057 / NRRL 8057) TaxID=1003195 RepID=F8JKQ8_STREN|nr:NAD(P)-dependent alcohol dehydrogenase [Streptantibioticus cattleyicolor]AEW98449.1 Alcohol dehydrogenase zinc-binding domain protein [Streptantibioticus cattleyicolor NRRL 8057 = DSM 46488]CCB72496.1 Aryl-alcohol dehydrogenase [Streptantibioticus cattleyicolor NRRL 8057 = DSM 46488]
MRIEAAVLRKPDQPFEMAHLELDEPGFGEVLVRAVASGVCHTDFLPRKGLPVTMPLVVGHEGAGVVEAVGPGVTGLAPGDHVVASFDSCGRCPACLSGRPNACTGFHARNLTGRRADGSTGARDADGTAVSARWFGQSCFADHWLATERNLVPVGKDLPLDKLGPFGCGLQTGAGAVLVAVPVGPGASLAVYGAGTLGLAAVMAARAAGAADITVVDLHPARRQLALELGATRAVDGADPDVTERVRDGRGEGYDLALDTTGRSSVVRSALAVLRPRGTCALVATGGDDLVIPPRALTAGRTLTYLLEGDAVPQVFIPRLIRLWQDGRFPFERLLTTYPLAGINDAERDTTAGTVVKPVLVHRGL